MNRAELRRKCERERSRTVAAILSDVERYLPRESTELADVRRSVMDAVEILVGRIIGYVEEAEDVAAAEAGD